MRATPGSRKHFGNISSKQTAMRHAAVTESEQFRREQFRRDRA